MSGVQEWLERLGSRQYMLAHQVDSLPEPTLVISNRATWDAPAQYRVDLYPETKEIRVAVSGQQHIRYARELAAVLLAADAYQKEWNLTHGK